MGTARAVAFRDEEFRARFGPEHRFRVVPREDRRFRYGGYWFVYTEPWPRNWDYEDDFYIDDIDGEYYLIDPVHPGIGSSSSLRTDS